LVSHLDFGTYRVTASYTVISHFDGWILHVHPTGHLFEEVELLDGTIVPCSRLVGFKPPPGNDRRPSINEDSTLGAGEVRNFGIELEKVNLPYFYRAFLSPLILLIVSLVCLIRFRDREKPVVGLWGSVLMVAAAFILSAVITRRGVDQFAPFSVLTCLLVFRQCKNLTKFAAVVVGLHAVFVVGAFVKTNVDRVHPYNAADYRDATAWLAKNTAPGEIVGQSVWSDFGPLFYWDPHNRFLGGMDPIFQYKFDPGTYWLMTLNAQARDIGKSSKYNPAIVFDKEEELSRIYPREFKTKWLFCAADWNKEIQDEIKKDPHTKVAYRDSHAVIYEFLPH
jgi:hypothetical protein